MRHTPRIPSIALLVVVASTSGDHLLLKRVRIPLVNIRKKYFVYLILVFFVSLILHEFGHIAVVLAGGGRITSFTLTRLTWEAQPSGDLPYLLGGPLVTLIICYFAVYKFFDDRKTPTYGLQQ